MEKFFVQVLKILHKIKNPVQNNASRGGNLAGRTIRQKLKYIMTKARRKEDSFMGKIKLAESKFVRVMRDKGLYITLGLCIVAAVGVGYYAYDKAIDEINSSLDYSVPDSSQKDAEQVNQTQTGVPKDTVTTPEVLDTIETASTAVMPVNGEVLTAYSNGELVKSETLGVWKTHDGVDIAADEGEKVKAMNDGTVTKVWEDPLWGFCIMITHSGNVESYYYNLGEATTVSQGDEVKAGDTIGVVGKSAQAEITMESHLHFGVKKNGAWTDPIEFVNPGSNK